MFQIYHSNQFDLLQLILCSIIKNDPIKNPLVSEIIIVPNTKVSKWLEIEIAKSLNITANIQFQLPDLFFWELFLKKIPFSNKNIFNIFNIKWILINIIPKIFNIKNNYIYFKEYLCNKNLEIDQKKLFDFSLNIAELFYKYLTYRDDLIKSWEKNEYINGLDQHQNWQLLLWQEIVKYLSINKIINTNYSDIYLKCIKKLNTISNIKKINLPQRIFIFGIDTLKPFYLKIIRYIEKYINIHFLIVNPCRHYWNDLDNHQYFIKTKINNTLKNIDINNNHILKEIKINNPLLNSWGKLGSEYLSILNEIKVLYNEVDSFVDVKNDSMIHSLQYDLLNLQNNSFLPINYPKLKNSISKKKVSIYDHSISVNVCASIYIEVKVLYNYIIKIMQNDKTIQPIDILVMAPNINSYSPFIKSVFLNTSCDFYIPFSILEEKTTNNLSSTILTFLKLLNLTKIEFSINNILQFLEEKILAEHFFIDKNGLIFLTNWIIKSGIFNKIYNNHNLEESEKYSWNSNLVDKYLQKLILNPKHNKKNIKLLKHFLIFLKQLEEWKIKLSIPKIINEWQFLYLDLINSFFSKQNNEFKIIKLLIEEKWNQVIHQLFDLKYKSKISIILIYEEIMNIFYNQNNIEDLFLNSGINFCTLSKTCSIPFKVICLLGMNEDEFPRNENSYFYLDLTRKKTKKADYNQNKHDRYIFLETILAVQNFLYISYISKDNYYNLIKYPTSLITELIEYVTNSFYLPGDEYCSLEQSSKKVFNYIHHFHTRTPFELEIFSINYLNNNSYLRNKICKYIDKNKIFFINKLSLVKNKTINLKDFLNFWKHPVRTWFNKKLGVNFYIESNNYYDTELFTIKKYQLYNINNKLLNALINKYNIYKLYIHNKNSGNLPYGSFGELFWKLQVQEMQKIANLVKNKISLRKKINFSLVCNDFLLKGKISVLENNGILKWSPNILNILDGLILWIEHIIFCANGGSGESIIYGKKQSFWKFLPLKKEDALTKLSNFISAYKEGLQSPLLLLNKSSEIWLNTIFDKKTKVLKQDIISQDKAYSKLLETLYGNYQSKGEIKDLYFQYCIDISNSKNIDNIINNIKKWYLPVLQANQYK